MTKKQELKWRLAKLPTPDEVRELVKDKIITQEEARDILFSSETVEEKDIESLKAEVKFLKEVIEKLSHNVTIQETIRYVDRPIYKQWPWYRDNIVWCSSQNVVNSAGTIGVDGNSLAKLIG